MKYIICFLLLLLAIVFITGCGEDIPILSNETLKVKGLTATQTSVGVGDTTTIEASVDYTGDVTVLMYTWTATVGKIRGTGNTVTYEAPTTPGTCTISVKVTDGAISSGDSIEIIITQQSNIPTIILDRDTYWLAENAKDPLSYDVNVTRIASGKVILHFEITQENDSFDAFLSIQIGQQTVLPEMAIGNELPSTGKVTTRDVDVSGAIKAPGHYMVTLYIRPGNRAQNGWLLNEATLTGVEGSSDPQQ
jgi:hypothetical protein